MSQVEWERVRRDVLSLMSNGLSDRNDRTARAFVDFAQGSGSSIIPEPRVRSWLPERLAAPGWASPMPWIPQDFWPYEFQARAFDRLSVSGQLPRPTVIAAPDGAGKSECFLLPMLDHCARQRGMSRPGIKALVIYASRASASENAARVASICRSVDRFHDLRPGLLIDDYGSTKDFTAGSVIDSIDGLVEHPPDLLLTVPEMLERSIMTKRLHGVWADTTPASLRFVVVDDIHLYTDQGIEDLAVLLRRLGVTLGMASPTQPLAGAVPVITAGIQMDPLDPPTRPVPPGSASGSDDRTEPTTSGTPGPVADEPRDGASFGTRGATGGTNQPSSLPRPTVDVRQGASALPSLGDTPTERPRADPTRTPFGSHTPGAGAPPTGMPSLSPLGAEDGEDDDASVSDPLLDLGHYLFGVRFGARSLVVGSTSTVDELQPRGAGGLPMPDLADLAGIPIDDFAALLISLFGPTVAHPQDPVQLGQMLLTHPLVRSIIEMTADQLTTAGDVVRAVSGQEGGGTSHVDARRIQGLQRVMALIGASQRLVGQRRVPLVRVEAQIDVHRSGRLVRLVDLDPVFALADNVHLDDPSVIPPPDLRLSATDPSAEPSSARHYLPAVACRNCGSSGWLAAVLGHDRLRASLPSQIGAPLGQQGGNLALMMLTDAHPTPGDRSVALLDTNSLDLHFAAEPGSSSSDEPSQSADQMVPVELGIGTALVSQRTCPVCDSRGSVDLLGADDAEVMAEVTRSMAGVTRGADGRGGRVLVLTMSSEMVHEQLEGFTSDQYVDELRRRIVEALGRSVEGAVTGLGDLATLIAGSAHDASTRVGIIPEDLISDDRLKSLREEQPSEADLSILRDRIMFELATEFGNRAANADSLTTTGVVQMVIDSEISEVVVDEILSKIRTETDIIVPPDVVRTYLTGLLEKMRANGAIRTPLLEQYIVEGGDPSFVSQQRPPGLRELVGTDRPRFVTTAVTSTFDSVTAIHQRPGGARTWLVEWTCSTLGINSVDAPSITWAALESLSGDHGAVFAIDSMDGHRVYGLRTEAIVVRTAPGGHDGSGSDHVTSGSSAIPGPTATSLPTMRLRTMSSVDASPFDKARMEWQFKYGTPDVAPNVFYMSAGALRTDRDVMDTTIDLAAVDALIADVDAIGDLTGVPEVSRTGTRAGHGTIVWVGGRRRDDDAATVDTEARLPGAPDVHRANELDYLLFLFDRVADGTIAFGASFETMNQAMAVAIELPDVGRSSASAPYAVPTEPPPTAAPPPAAAPPPVPPPTSDVPRPGFGHRTPVPVPDAPRLEKSVGFVPVEFTNEGKGLFEVLVGSSKSDGGPSATFGRLIAVDGDPTRSTVMAFARSDVAGTLERIRSEWLADPGSEDATTTVGDALRDLVSDLNRSAPPTVPPAGRSLRRAPTGMKVADPPPSGSERVTTWLMEDIPLRVDAEADRVRMTIPVMDIQGRARAYSVAVAVVKGIRRVVSPETGSDLRAEARLRRFDGSDLDGTIDVPSVGEGSARGVWCIDLYTQSAGQIDHLAGPDVVREMLESARRVATYSIERRDEAGTSRADAFAGVLNVTEQDQPGRLVTDGQPVAVSPLLALETVERILDHWTEPVPVGATGVAGRSDPSSPVFADEVLRKLAARELARAFELSLHTWLLREPDVMGSVAPLVGTDLELKMTFDQTERRYRIERTDHDESAVYRIRPLSDAQDWPTVLLRLVDDRFDPHTVAEPTDRKRPGVEDVDADLRWFLTWSDIAEFYVAAAAADAADVSDRDLFTESQRERVTADLQHRSTRIRMESLEQNPMALLLDLLARPYQEDWRVTADSILGVLGDRPDDPTTTGRGSELTILQHHLDGLAGKFTTNGQRPDRSSTGPDGPEPSPGEPK